MSGARVDTDSPMSAEQLLALPDDGMRYELVRGELVTMPAAGYPHGIVSMAIGVELRNFVKPRRLGHVLATDTGFTLERGPDTVRAPDAAFVQSERVPPPGVRGFAELAPDLVAEVVSPNDRPGEVTEKALMWLDKGVRLVWVVDPDERVAWVYLPGRPVRLLRGDDAALDGHDVLPGFRLPLADLWEDLPDTPPA